MLGHILNVIEDPDTDMDTLIQLAEHEDWYVRTRVAENLRIPSDTLDRLSKDSDYSVRRRVAQNPNTQAETLVALSQVEMNRVTRIYVHMHPNTPFGMWILQMRVIP